MIKVHTPNIDGQLKDLSDTQLQELRRFFITFPEAKDLLDDDRIDDLYTLFLRAGGNAAQLTRLLYQADIDPLDYITVMPAGMFIGEDITRINVPANVLSLGQFGCSMCHKLISVTLPENLSSIARSCFDSCSNLSQVTLPSKLTVIEEEAFVNCYSLSSIDLPLSIQRVAPFAFKSCGGMYATKPEKFKINYAGTEKQFIELLTNSKNTCGRSSQNAIVSCSDGDSDLWTYWQQVGI